MPPTIVRACLIKIFDNSIMPKRKGRKLKGGEPLATSIPPPPQMGNMPTMSPSQGAAVKNSSVAPKALPPNPSPVKSSPPAKVSSPQPPQPPQPSQPKVPTPPPTSSEKTLATAEESISFFEKYGYEIAIAGVVILIISIVVYYLFIRDIPGQNNSDDSDSESTPSPAAASQPSAASQSATISSPPASSSEPEPANATEDNEESTDTPQEADGDGSTEGFTVEILDSLVNNNNKQDREFEPGRPDIWKPEANSLLPGQNI